MLPLICFAEEERSVAKNDRQLAAYFEVLETTNGTHIALFIMCGITDTAFVPALVPVNICETKGDHWKIYKAAVDKSGENGGFKSGITDIRRVFGKNLSESDLGRFLSNERTKPGTEAQRRKWGTEPLYKDFPLTNERYDELDEKYESWLQRYKGVTIDPRMEETLITVCKRSLVANWLFAKSEIKESAAIQKMNDDMLAAEQMRKKDEKPVENMRMDALVVALEKAGLMEEGQLLPYDDLVEALRDNFLKSPKYQYSLDVADQLILASYNTMRKNGDMPTVIDLPDEMLPEDEYGEFLPEETEQERKNREYAGLTRVRPAKGDE